MGEDLVPLEPELRAKDPFIGVQIRRLLGDAWFCGEVLDVEQGKDSKELVYLVRYSDGDRQHLTSGEVRQWSVPRADATTARMRAPAVGAQRRRPLSEASVVVAQSKPSAAQPPILKSGSSIRQAASASAAPDAVRRSTTVFARSPQQCAVLVSVGVQTIDVGLRPLRLLGQLPDDFRPPPVRQPARLARLHGRRQSAVDLPDDEEEEELVEEDLEEDEHPGRPRHRFPPFKRRREEIAYDNAGGFEEVWDHEDDADLEDEYDMATGHRDLVRYGRRERLDGVHGRRTIMRAVTALPPARTVTSAMARTNVPESHSSLRCAPPSPADAAEVEEEYFDEEGEEEELQEYTDNEMEEEEEEQGEGMPFERSMPSNPSALDVQSRVMNAYPRGAPINPRGGDHLR